MSKILALLGVCLSLAFTQSAMAQSGTVKAQGQAIPGVTVKATMGERALTTVTDENGVFQFTGMTPGTWTVEADMFGFDHLNKEVPITDTPTTIDLTLQLGTRAEPVKPPAPPAQLTQRGGANRGPAQQEQPLEVAPPPVELAQAAPDVSNDAFLVQGTVSNGLQTNNNDFRQDGGFGPNGFGGPGGDLGPGGPGGPEGQPGGGNPGGGGRGGRGGGGGNFNGGGGGGFPGGGGGFPGGGGGRGGGGGGRGGNGRGGRQPGLIGNRSRQGANQIRINAFDTISDSAFNARQFSTSGQAAAKAPYLSNRYGINIGGPAIIPHLFDLSSKLNFTLNYNGTTATRGIDDVATVPTAAERSGDFSAITNPIYIPGGGGTQFANNQIPVTSISPIAEQLLKYVPLPNQPGTIQNYRFVTSNPNNAQQVSLRLQYTLSAKDRLSVTVQTQHTSSTTTSVLGFNDGTSANGQNESVQWTHNFTPRMFNNFQVGLNRQSTVATNFFANSGVTFPDIAGIAPDPRNDGPPSLSFTNFGQLLTDGYPSDTAVQQGNVQDTFTIRRGKHNLQFGGLFNRYDTNQLTDTNSRGSFQFTGQATELMGANGVAVRNTGYDFADYLLGLPTTDSVRYGASSQYLRGIGYSFFANDDWRLSSTISLQLGLRYEYTSPFSEKYGHLANIEFTPGFNGPATVVTPNNTVINGVAYGPGGFPPTMVNADRNNFAPRVGIAWRAMKKGNLIVRSGWGIYYNEGVYNAIGQRLSQQAPFAMSSGTLQTTPSNVLTLGNGLVAIPAGNTITDTYAWNPNYRDAYSQNWNFGLQRDAPGNLVLNANYDGIKGTRLNVVIDPNQALPGQFTTLGYPIPNASLLSYTEPVGNSILHRGVFQVTRRMRANISFGLTYTLVKSLDDTPGGTVQNPLDISAERALSAGVSKDTVAFTWTFQSPVDGRKGFLANKGFLTKSLKDWTFQGPIQWKTGAPFTATVQGDIANVGNTTNQRVEATGLPITSGNGYFNPAAFVVPASGTYGNAGRDTIIGPDQFTASLNMSRTFQLKERKSLEIQLNSTNVLNHVNITSFGTTVGAYGYGVATNAGGMRTASFTLRFRM